MEEHLRLRWLTQQGHRLRAAVLQSLRTNDEHWGDKLRELPFSEEVPRHEDLRGIDFSGEDLNGVDLAFVHLDGARFDGCQLERVALSNARLAGASFIGARLARANLTQVLADDATFEGADLSDAWLDSARFRRTSFRKATLIGTHLGSAEAIGADFRGAAINNLDISGSDLTGACWDGEEGTILGRWYAVTSVGLASTEQLESVVNGGSITDRVRDLLAQTEATVASSPERCFSFEADGVATLSVAGQRYCAGQFSTPSIGELKARIQSRPSAKQGSIRIVKLAGVHPLTDIGTLQATAPEGTLFQVASHFNSLWARGSTILPVHRYLSYSSQGGRASVSAFPGTFLRHYFMQSKGGEAFEQTDAGALNLLEDVFDESVAEIRAGHLAINRVRDRTRLATVLEERFDHIRVGVHDQLQVVFGCDWGGPVPRGSQQRIAQVFTSTVALGEHGPDRSWEEVAIAKSLLRAAYLGTLLAAIDLGKRRVVFTLLGGGPFGNLQNDVAEAIFFAIAEAEPYVDGSLTVIINTRSLPSLIPDDAVFATHGVPITFDGKVIANRLTLPDFESLWKNSWTELQTKTQT
ncbi:pentapeptide repeat-containing protein [Pendulispora brunnea]|uniref:Pentapeptide repeat-containing protein n=1 Tax=Pendulispora brunnea TaxID=2905690 RepID=A0ABZ2JWP4_9BACT